MTPKCYDTFWLELIVEHFGRTMESIPKWSFVRCNSRGKSHIWRVFFNFIFMSDIGSIWPYIFKSKTSVLALLAMRVLTFVILKRSISKRKYFRWIWKHHSKVLQNASFKVRFTINTPIKLKQRTQEKMRNIYLGSLSYLHIYFIFHYVFSLLLLLP